MSGSNFSAKVVQYMAQINTFPTDQVINQAHVGIPALTIEEAKLGISKKLGITPECIEITIRA
jgi:hypothetical protein